MTAMIVIEDNKTDGAIPAKGNVCMDEATGKVRVDFEDFSIFIPRDVLEMVMYEDLHG